MYSVEVWWIYDEKYVVLQIAPTDVEGGVFEVEDGCLVWCGGNIRMLRDLRCVNNCHFFNRTLIGHQFFTAQGYARIPDSIRQLLSNGACGSQSTLFSSFLIKIGSLTKCLEIHQYWQICHGGTLWYVSLKVHSVSGFSEKNNFPQNPSQLLKTKRFDTFSLTLGIHFKSLRLSPWYTF